MLDAFILQEMWKELVEQEVNKFVLEVHKFALDVNRLSSSSKLTKCVLRKTTLAIEYIYFPYYGIWRRKIIIYACLAP